MAEIVRHTFRAWLSLAVLSVSAAYARLSFAWAVAATATITLLWALGIGLGDPWRRGPIGGPVRQLLGGEIEGLDQATCNSLGGRIDVAYSLLPGLLAGCLLALALPVAPFQHPTIVGVALVVTLVVWPLGSLVVSSLLPFPWALRTGPSRRTTPPWRKVMVAAALPLALVLAFALVQAILRPSPDRYWSSLVPARTWDQDEWNRYLRNQRIRTTQGLAIENDAASVCVGVGQCHGMTEDGVCVGVSMAYDMSRIQERSPSACPSSLTVRRDPRGGKLVLARDDTYPNLFWGSPSAFIVLGPTDPDARHRSTEGPVLTALQVSGSVAVPTPWTLLACFGVAFAVFVLQRLQRREAREGGSPPVPYRDPAQVPPDELARVGRDRRQDEALAVRYVRLVLVVSCAPMVLALVLGVGR